jgi:uncharacterized protein YggE
MKRLKVAVTFMVALCALTTAAWVQGSEEGNEPEIVATGVGRVEADPEKARIDITVRAFGKTIDEAAEICASNYVHLLDTLKAAGIGSERVITRYFDAYPEKRGKKRRKTIGHSYVHKLYIDTKDADEIPKIASYALYSGVASANVVWLLSSGADSVRSMALVEATLDAKAEAEAMAVSAGGMLGELIELTTHYPENPTFPTWEAESQAVALKSGIIQWSSIKPKKIKVNVSVLGRWRLIGGFGN